MLLKNGSKGDDVKKLQEKLGVEAIGTFGPKTEAAVKAWQKANGLVDDGIVGDATWSKLFGAATSAAPVIKEDVVVPKSTGSMNLDKLKGHVPDTVIAQIPVVMEKFQINTPLRLAVRNFANSIFSFSRVVSGLSYCNTVNNPDMIITKPITPTKNRFFCLLVNEKVLKPYSVTL